MTAQIRWFLARLNSNYWFYPALLSLAAAALALIMVSLDHSGLAKDLSTNLWLVPESPDGASTMLSVIAGSMIGVAATVFSITIAAVAFASGSYGPRLLNNFMQDRGNQLSLATFIATFVYSTLVLGAIRLDANAVTGFVPQLALLAAYALMALSIAVLVYFLNHVPASIRINTVLKKIGARLIEEIDQTYPERGVGAPAQDRPKGFPLVARDTGYIQLIEYDDLAKIGADCSAQIVLAIRTGDFLHPGVVLAEITGSLPDEDKLDALRDAFKVGEQRTPEQDLQFLIDELVEIGVRALSPGINDPFTAVTALHWLGAAISDLGQRNLVMDIELDRDEQRHVLPLPDDFDHFLRRSFGAMRGAVAASPIAAKVLFGTLSNAASPIASADRRDQLVIEGQALRDQARETLRGPDLTEIEQAFAQFGKAMQQST